MAIVLSLVSLATLEILKTNYSVQFIMRKALWLNVEDMHAVFANYI